MASSFTLADNIINTKIKATTTTIGLFKSDPGRDDTGIEVDAPSYTRMPITFDDVNNGTVRNDTDITFPQATESWGIITHYAIYDIGNNLLYADKLLYNDEIVAGRIITIPSQQLQLQVI